MNNKQNLTVPYESFTRIVFLPSKQKKKTDCRFSSPDTWCAVRIIERRVCFVLHANQTHTAQNPNTNIDANTQLRISVTLRDSPMGNGAWLASSSDDVIRSATFAYYRANQSTCAPLSRLDMSVVVIRSVCAQSTLDNCVFVCFHHQHVVANHTYTYASFHPCCIWWWIRIMSCATIFIHKNASIFLVACVVCSMCIVASLACLHCIAEQSVRQTDSSSSKQWQRSTSAETRNKNTYKPNNTRPICLEVAHRLAMWLRNSDMCSIARCCEEHIIRIIIIMVVAFASAQHNPFDNSLQCLRTRLIDVRTYGRLDEAFTSPLTLTDRHKREGITIITHPKPFADILWPGIIGANRENVCAQRSSVIARLINCHRGHATCVCIYL